MSTPTIFISGVLLSRILYDAAESPTDMEGLLLGTVDVRRTTSINDDDAILEKESRSIHITGWVKRDLYTPRFYDPSGTVTSLPSNAIGYLRGRRNTSPNHLTMRELSLRQSFATTLVKNNRTLEARHVLIGTVVGMHAPESLATHDVHIGFWMQTAHAKGNRNTCERVPFRIVNMEHGTSEEYRVAGGMLSRSMIKHVASDGLSGVAQVIRLI